MKAGNILVPTDIAACPLALFSFLNEYANDGFAKITLYHVSKLNVAPLENRLYAEVEREIEKVLLRLQAAFLHPQIDTDICVSAGKPAREIVAQAESTKSDLIVMTRSSTHRKNLFRADVVKQVVDRAPCPVCVLRVGVQIDCRRLWTPGEKDSTAQEPLIRGLRSGGAFSGNPTGGAWRLPGLVGVSRVTN